MKGALMSVLSERCDSGDGESENKQKFWTLGKAIDSRRLEAVLWICHKHLG